MSEHNTTVGVIIGGIHRELLVSFTITSWGYGGSWDEPPEPPEFEINDIRDDETGRDMYAFCDDTRDLWAKPHYANGYWQKDWKGRYTFNGHYYNLTLMQSIMDNIGERLGEFDDSGEYHE